MTQAQHILDQFSDAYLAAMLDGSDRTSVLATYKLTHSDISAELQDQARQLDVLYGYLETSEAPTNAEIAQAYKKFALAEPDVQPVKQQGFFAKLSSAFMSPSYAYRIATIAAVFVLALLVWRPWSTTSTMTTSPSLAPTISDDKGSLNTQSSPEEVHNPINPTTTPSPVTSTPDVSPAFRGFGDDDNTDQGPAPASSDDANRLRQLAQTKIELAIPKGLSLDAISKGTINIQWDAVDGALSYIIEVKGANDRAFHPVTEVAHPSARLGMLTSGDTVSVRVIAASGERKGQPSDAKSIVVP